jgi:hypothetical protein
LTQIAWRARGFYEHFGFRPSASEPLQLLALLRRRWNHSLDVPVKI